MQVNAKVRTIQGTKVKKLRDSMSVPAVVYGLGNPSIMLEIDYNEFIRTYKKAGDTTLLDLNFDSSTKKVLVKEIQKNPVSGKIIHVSFIEVNLKEKIKACIPVNVIGEDVSPILKSGEGILNIIKQEIEIEALPTNLIHEFVVDVSNLENIGDEIKVSNLNYDRSKIELVDLTEDDLILNIDRPQQESEEENALTEEEMIAKIEVTSEKKEEESEEESK